MQDFTKSHGNCSRLLPLSLWLWFLLVSILTTNALADDTPLMPQGIQIGDPTSTRAIIWSRTDRPARMMVKYAYNPDFLDAVIIPGSYALEETDFTTRLDLAELQEGKDVYLKVWFETLSNSHAKSDVVSGHFHTIGKQDDIRFVWGGDTAGQGWGINENIGGMKIYESMRRVKPLFFIDSGDNIYADSPLTPTLSAENDLIWNNLVAPEVTKVAETLAEFRGRYKYNLLDKNLRLFNAEVPQIWQWDDHEVVNNWSESKDLSQDNRYKVKDVNLLLARAAKAFHEYAPMRPYSAEEAERIYRKMAFGKLLDVFVLDMRSYRGANSSNLQPKQSQATAFMGRKQLSWLKQSLKASHAVWKILAADMPLGLNISDGIDTEGNPRWEAVANADNGKAAGRELEIAELLSFIKHENINNTVWLTADVHYAAAHYFDPEKAITKDFSGFWEFVAGPLNAGTFGPNSVDATFGPQVVFSKTPGTGQTNLSPLAGLQFFGEVNINRKTRALTIDLKDLDGNSLFRTTLSPQILKTATK